MHLVNGTALNAHLINGKALHAHLLSHVNVFIHKICDHVLNNKVSMYMNSHVCFSFLFLMMCHGHFFSICHKYKYCNITNQHQQYITMNSKMLHKAMITFYFFKRKCSASNCNGLSCTPDRDILRFTPCEKFFSYIPLS